MMHRVLDMLKSAHVNVGYHRTCAKLILNAVHITIFRASVNDFSALTLNCRPHFS